MDPVRPLTDRSDAEIIQAVLDGQSTLYEEIVQRYQDRIRTALSFCFISSDDIEEHLQETFVQAYIHLGRYNPETPLYPWLKAIALNAMKMEFRRLETVRRRGAEYLRHVHLQQAVETADDVDDAARAAALKSCIEELPERERKLMEARYRENTPLADLAERLEITPGALKVRLLRLRYSLRECVERRLARGQHA